MAKTQLLPQQAEPEVTPVVAPVVAKGGPKIDLLGEDADKVKFTVNPDASHYVVDGRTGIVVEYLK